MKVVMSKASDHIVPGTLCICCRVRPATYLTRLVTRDDSMEQDALLYGAPTCYPCAEKLAQILRLGERLMSSPN